MSSTFSQRSSCEDFNSVHWQLYETADSKFTNLLIRIPVIAVLGKWWFRCLVYFSQLRRATTEYDSYDHNYAQPILKVEEGDVLSDKIYSRLLYPPQIHSMTSIVYRPPPESSASLRSQRPMYFNTTCSFCMEKFERGAPVTRLPCNHLFHFEE